ncbi:MAG: metal ABC transporter substrate-binding protein [bacterium]
MFKTPVGKIFLAIAAIACLAGFRAPAFAAVRVVTTTPDLAAIAREVGKEKVQVESLGKGNQNPHFVDPKPSFMVKLQKANLLVIVGLDLEIGYLPPLLDGARNSKIRKGSPGYVDASAGCRILEVPDTKIDRSMGDIHVYGNPHYWLDPGNGKIIAKNIADGLSRVDPANADLYAENAKQFAGEIDKRMSEWKKRLLPFKDAEIVTYHKSWTYFEERFQLNVSAYIEPKPGIPPTPSHTVEVIQTIKSRNIKVIAVEPFYDRKAADAIASRTGAKVIVLPSSVGGLKGVDTYFDLFDYITEQLASAMK